MLVTAATGFRLILELLTTGRPREDLVLFLFTNQLNLGDSTTLTDLVELSGGGYMPVTLSGSKWTISPDEQGRMAAAYQDTVVFSFIGIPGGQLTADVWGYGIRMGQVLVWAELLDDGPKPKAFEIAVAGEDGDKVKIKPRYFLQAVK